jgi:hypothetical protein
MNSLILIDPTPSGCPTTATQEPRHAERLHLPGRSVQRTRGADMMARRTGNPRLARHKRQREAQPAIDVERDDIARPNNIAAAECAGHNIGSAQEV